MLIGSLARSDSLSQISDFCRITYGQHRPRSPPLHLISTILSTPAKLCPPTSALSAIHPDASTCNSPPSNYLSGLGAALQDAEPFRSRGLISHSSWLTCEKQRELERRRRFCTARARMACLHSDSAAGVRESCCLACARTRTRTSFFLI